MTWDWTTDSCMTYSEYDALEEERCVPLHGGVWMTDGEYCDTWSMLNLKKE